MTEAQIDDLVSRSAAGEGVEKIIKSMGLDSSRELAYLKKHPTAPGRLIEAKGIQKQDPVVLERLAREQAAKTV